MRPMRGSPSLHMCTQALKGPMCTAGENSRAVNRNLSATRGADAGQRRASAAPIASEFLGRAIAHLALQHSLTARATTEHSHSSSAVT